MLSVVLLVGWVLGFAVLLRTNPPACGEAGFPLTFLDPDIERMAYLGTPGPGGPLLVLGIGCLVVAVVAWIRGLLDRPSRMLLTGVGLLLSVGLTVAILVLQWLVEQDVLHRTPTCFQG